MELNKILKFSICFLIASNSYAQCKKEVLLGNEFTLHFPKKYSIIEANDSLKEIQESFQCTISNGLDTVRAFVADELYTQATLNIRQDILSMDSISSFKINSSAIQDLQEVRDVHFIKKRNQLIVIDYGPKNLKGERPIEFYCHDFTTRKTLVINSSSSLIHWDENLSKISRRMTREIAKSI